MNPYDYPDALEARVRPTTEPRLAERLSRDGATVRFANGRYWRMAKRGFFMPLHDLARFSFEEARRPGLCWGYRAGLHDEDRERANASIPLHLIADLAGYGETSLAKSKRRSLKRSEAHGIRMVVLPDDAIMEQQGYAVAREWHVRKGFAAPSEDRFRARMRRMIDDEAWVVIAALDGDRMLGFSTAWAIDRSVHLHSWAFLNEAIGRKLDLGFLMGFTMINIFKRSGLVTEASAGLAQPEQAGATSYKLEQGIPIIDLPARLSMPRLAARLLYARDPQAYYRLSGRVRP